MKNLIVLLAIDVEGIKNLVNPYIVDFTTLLLWAIPIVASAVALVTGVKWFSKDEDEREQKPLSKSLSKILFWAIILELIPVLFKLFGL